MLQVCSTSWSEGQPLLAFNPHPALRPCGQDGGYEHQSLDLNPGFLMRIPYDALDPHAQLAAKGRFTVPVTRPFHHKNGAKQLKLTVGASREGRWCLFRTAEPRSNRVATLSCDAELLTCAASLVVAPFGQRKVATRHPHFLVLLLRFA